MFCMSDLFVMFWNCVQVYVTFRSVIVVWFVVFFLSFFLPVVRKAVPLFVNLSFFLSFMGEQALWNVML